MSNICLSHQNKECLFPVFKSPTQIGFISVKKQVETSSLITDLLPEKSLKMLNKLLAVYQFSLKISHFVTWPSLLG